MNYLCDKKGCKGVTPVTIAVCCHMRRKTCFGPIQIELKNVQHTGKQRLYQSIMSPLAWLGAWYSLERSDNPHST